VFHATTARATSSTQASLALAQLPAFDSWGGVAADAARDAIGKTRVDLDTHAQEARAVAQAAEQAAQDIEKVKLDRVDVPSRPTVGQSGLATSTAGLALQSAGHLRFPLDLRG
jgi:hypothetical protein